MKEIVRRFIPLLVILLLMAVVLLPQKLEEKACNDFGAPLFEHALPEGAAIIQQDAAKDDEGGVTAAIILQTDLTSEELEAFYSDTKYPPMEEGQTVSLSAKPLDEASIEAMKQAERYEEGASYQFVYLYCK